MKLVLRCCDAAGGLVRSEHIEADVPALYVSDAVDDRLKEVPESEPRIVRSEVYVLAFEVPASMR